MNFFGVTKLLQDLFLSAVLATFGSLVGAGVGVAGTFAVAFPFVAAVGLVRVLLGMPPIENPEQLLQTAFGIVALVAGGFSYLWVFIVSMKGKSE